MMAIVFVTLDVLSARLTNPLFAPVLLNRKSSRFRRVLLDFLKIIVALVLLFKLQMRRSASWFGILSFIRAICRENTQTKISLSNGNYKSDTSYADAAKLSPEVTSGSILHIITPVKGLHRIDSSDGRSVLDSKIGIPFTYTVYNDFSTLENTALLESRCRAGLCAGQSVRCDRYAVAQLPADTQHDAPKGHSKQRPRWQSSNRTW